MVEYSVNDIIIEDNKHFVFDIDKLNKDTAGWYSMLLKVGGMNLIYDINYIDTHMDKGLCFYSDSNMKDNFFGYDPRTSTSRACAIVEFEAFNKQTITLEHTANTKVTLNDYLSTVVEKKFDKWTTKIHVGDLIWFRIRYYADDNHERVIDITSVGFVVHYSENMLSIHFRDIDNTVTPNRISMRTIDIYPDRLRMFDWYVIDENNKKEVTK